MKIKLRDWRLQDLDTYQKFNTGHHTWMDFDGPYYPKLTPSELEEQIDSLRKRISTDNFPSIRKNKVIADEQDQILGTVSRYWQSEETNWLSIGLVIFDEQSWGKGIGYKALSQWCDYLFEEMPELARLDLRTWSGNHGMMKLAEKLGFQLEARFRNARIIKGEYFDSIGYGILREEWGE